MFVFQVTATKQATDKASYSFSLDPEKAAAVLKQLGVKASQENIKSFASLQSNAVNGADFTTDGRVKDKAQLKRDVAFTLSNNGYAVSGFAEGLANGELKVSNFISFMVRNAVNSATKAQQECSTQRGMDKILGNYGVTNNVLNSLLSSPQKAASPSDTALYFAFQNLQQQNQSDFMRETEKEMKSRFV